MKSNLKYLVLGILIFVVCFAGVKRNPSSIYVHREDNFVIPNPQVLVEGTWNPVEFTLSQWFGEQFTFNPVFPYAINLARGPFHPIAFAVVKSTANQCQARLAYITPNAENIIGLTQLPTIDGFVVIPVEPAGFLTNKEKVASLQLQVQCDGPASISMASLHLVNQ